MKLPHHCPSPRFTRAIRTIPILLALSLFTFGALAQHQVLALQMPNPKKNAYYEVGDRITFYLSDKRSKRTERILALEDSIILFRGYTVPVSEITALHIDDKTRWWLRYKPAQIALIAGTGYILLDAVNNQEFDEDVLVVGGSLIGAGLLLKLLIPNKIKIRKRTKLSILTV